MNGVLLKYQLTTCGVLAAVLCLEIAGGELSQSRLQDTLNKRIDSEYQSDPLPSLELPKQTPDSYSTIIERPLFIEGRKPLPEAAQESAETDTDTGQLDDWELIGLYSTDSKPMALFRKQNEAKKYLRIHEQQSISGWLLKQIQADKVILQLGGQQKSVMLRKPRHQAKLPSPFNRPTVPAKPVIPGAVPNTNTLENNDNDR